MIGRGISWMLMVVLGVAGALPVAAGFPDALAQVAARIEAQPGKDSGRRWVATAPGSVRFVGRVRADGEAQVDVLVGGASIWSRKLGGGAVPAQAFDVPVYELAAGATIDVRVRATTGPVAADLAYEVVPEPFLARWAATRPTGFPTWSEAEKKQLRDKGQKVLQTIRTASKEKRGKITIPPGDYLFHAQWSQASTLRDLQDLTIEAEGVTFWFEPPLIHALLFENCRNVTVRGLDIDFTIPCWLQARVSEVDRTAKTVRAIPMPGYEPRNSKGEAEKSGNRAFMFYDAEGRFINQQHSPGSWRMLDDGRTLVCEKIDGSGIPASLKPGDYVVGTLRTGAALRSNGCAGMRFENINVWSSPGMAVNENGGPGGNQYLKVRATRRPLTNRLHAFGADIFHLAGTDRGPILERCELAYGADDNLNIHGSFGRVVKRQDERRYYLQGAYSKGDTLEFRDPRSVALLGTAKVVAATPAPDGPALQINEKYQAKGEVLVELDQPLTPEPLALVVMDGKRSAAGFVLRDCWLHDNFQRTLINGSPRGLIENNTLQNLGHGITVMFETWGPWMEGPFARDLVIRNNRFLDSPPAGPAISVSMHPPGGGSNARRFDARPLTNLTIEGNHFARTTNPPLSIHNVEGLTIRSNSFDFPADAPPAKGLANQSPHPWLYLQDSANVKIEP